MTAELVGDDVVDLGDAAIHPRFADRITSPDERAMLAATPSSARAALLWTLFAGKEAAFKVAAKLGATPVFAHARFEVASDLTSVRWQAHVFTLRIERGDGFVHAVATTGGRPIAARVGPSESDASRAARRLLVGTLAPSLGVGSDRLAVHREPRAGSWDGFGPPALLVDGAPGPLDVSLSHDGRFVSFAAV